MLLECLLLIAEDLTNGLESPHLPHLAPGWRYDWLISSQKSKVVKRNHLFLVIGFAIIVLAKDNYLFHRPEECVARELLAIADYDGERECCLLPSGSSRSGPGSNLECDDFVNHVMPTLDVKEVNTWEAHIPITEAVFLIEKPKKGRVPQVPDGTLARGIKWVTRCHGYSSK